MEDTYRFLRQVEHRLQIMFDRQTHQMPRDLEEQRTLAIRMGYPPRLRLGRPHRAGERFLADYRTKTELNRQILNHLLHDAFPDDGAAADPVVDLVLDPTAVGHVAEVLGRLPSAILPAVRITICTVRAPCGRMQELRESLPSER